MEIIYPANPPSKKTTFECGDPTGELVVYVPAVDCGRPCTRSTQLYESLDITSLRLHNDVKNIECPKLKAEQMQIVEHLLAARSKEKARTEGRLLSDIESFNGVAGFVVRL